MKEEIKNMLAAFRAILLEKASISTKIRKWDVVLTELVARTDFIEELLRTEDVYPVNKSEFVSVRRH